MHTLDDDGVGRRDNDDAYEGVCGNGEGCGSSSDSGGFVRGNGFGYGYFFDAGYAGNGKGT